jgi:hypothetical protein
MARAFTPLVKRIGRLVAGADRLAAWARAGLSERLEQAERETQAAVAREAVRRRGGQIDYLSHRVLRSTPRFRTTTNRSHKHLKDQRARTRGRRETSWRRCSG